MKQSGENDQKPLFWRQKVEYFGDTFFLRNRASSLFYIYQSLTSCKKSEKSNDGKYENFWDRRTDGRTDWRRWLHKDSRGSPNKYNLNAKFTFKVWSQSFKYAILPTLFNDFTYGYQKREDWRILRKISQNTSFLVILRRLIPYLKPFGWFWAQYHKFV